MDEQRLQAVIDHANEIGDTAPTLAAYLCATVAEVRRLQQQSQEMAHELTQTARASQHFEQQVTALIAERDAALSERDALQVVRDQMADGIMRCIDASWSGTRSMDWTHPELILAEYVGDMQATLTRLQQEREGLIAPCMCCREVTQPCQHGCRCSVDPTETQEPTR